MLRERGLKLISVILIKLLRALFRLPNWLVAVILWGAYKAAGAAKLPTEVVSDMDNARRAMRDGPPLSESLRGIILKSDPELLVDFVFNALRGEPPLREVNPW